MRKFIVSTLALALFASIAVHADTVSFVPASGSGSWGVSQKAFTSGGVSITATSFYYNGSAWVQGGVLFGRNDGGATEQGLGVCSPNEMSSSSCYSFASGMTGGGDVNELSNESQQELIRLTLPSGYKWSSVGISSLDSNGGTTFENGILWAGNNATPTGGPGSLNNATNICAFVGSNPVGVSGPCTVLSGGSTGSPTFSISTGSSGAQYLFFEAYNLNNPSLTNNDYLVKSATVTTPEPSGMALLASGLVALGGLVRRRTK